MKNTKANRLKFLRKQFKMLGKNQSKLHSAVEKLFTVETYWEKILIP